MAATRRSLPPSKGGKFIRRDIETGRFTDAADRDDARFSDASNRYQDNDGGRSIYHPSQDARGAQDGHVRPVHTKAAQSTVKAVAATKATITKYRDAHFYPKEIFSSQAEYDASVDSVVARIQSGEVKARTPDE